MVSSRWVGGREKNQKGGEEKIKLQKKKRDYD
jgi:hypothetical protein